MAVTLPIENVLRVERDWDIRLGIRLQQHTTMVVTMLDFMLLTEWAITTKWSQQDHQNALAKLSLTPN